MNKHRGIFRALATATSCLLALALAVGLSGCGNNDEELIRTSVTEVMEVFKNPTPENLQEYIDDTDVDTSELEQYGIDLNEFLVHCFKHFDYTINDVKIDGDTATVDVTVTNADVQKAMEEATNAVMGNLNNYSDLLTAEDGEQQFMKIFFDEVYQQLDASEELVTNDTTLKLNKTDGEWDVDKEALDDVVSAMYGGLEI